MAIFVPPKINKEGTEDELFAWELMGPGRPEPPLEPEEDLTPPQNYLDYNPPDRTINGKTYQWRHFPAAVCPCLYPGNPNANNYPVESYGRYGYIYETTHDFLVPFWYDEDMPDEMLYMQFHICHASNISNQKTPRTSYDTNTGQITTATQSNPRLEFLHSNQWTFQINNSAVQQGSTTLTQNASASWVFPSNFLYNALVAAQVNRPQSVQQGLYTISIAPHLNGRGIFASFSGWWPTDWTFRERNGSEWSANNTFRLSENIQNNNWKFTYLGTTYPILGLNEQSEDKDNMHAYVQKNPGVKMIQPFTMPPSMLESQWPCLITMLGSGYAEFVDDAAYTTSSSPLGPSRADNQNLRWQRSAFYPSPSTIGWAVFVTSGSGIVFSAVTYMCKTTENVNDRDLKGYGNNQGGWPTTRWQQGITSFRPEEWNTGLPVHISVWNDTTKKWERPVLP